MNRILLAALAAAALSVPAIGSRPPAAQAGGLCSLGIFSGVCGQDAPPIPDPFSCSLSNPVVRTTADGNSNNYEYDLVCNRGDPTIHVVGGYSFDTKRANESLSFFEMVPGGDPAIGADRRLDFISTKWHCDHDPWIAPSPQPCDQAEQTLGYDGAKVFRWIVPYFDIVERTQPYSTQYLDDAQRLILFQAQLQAAAHPTAPAPASFPGIDPSTVFQASTNVLGTRCGACSVFGSAPASAQAPTLPDFQIMAVRAEVPNLDPVTNKELLANGMTANYEVVVANLGAKMPQINADPSKKPQVQVSIQVTGSLQYLGITQPDGWDCSGKGPILCVGPLGGYGDAIQDTVVIFRLQILGAKVGVGVGAISAAADPNGLIKESDVTNNALTLAVTVK